MIIGHIIFIFFSKKVVCEMIGKSEILFGSFAGYCATSSLIHKEKNWGELLLSVTVGLQEEGKKMRSFEKFHDFALLLDRCRRQGRLDNAALKSLIDSLRSMIVTQANHLEKQHAKDIESYHIQHPAATQRSKEKTKKTKGLELVPDQFSIPNAKHPKARLSEELQRAWRYIADLDNCKVFANKVNRYMNLFSNRAKLCSHCR